jgi:hypothetical protein
MRKDDDLLGLDLAFIIEQVVPSGKDRQRDPATVRLYAHQEQRMTLVAYARNELGAAGCHWKPGYVLHELFDADTIQMIRPVGFCVDYREVDILGEETSYRFEVVIGECLDVGAGDGDGWRILIDKHLNALL